MNAFDCSMKITPLGDAAVLVEIGEDALAVRSLAEALAREKLAGIKDIVPAYTTVAVFYNPAQIARTGTATPHEQISTWLADVEKHTGHHKAEAGRERVIPVCYGGTFGPDIDAVAVHAGLSTDDVIKLHSTAKYEVRAVGFSPGFPYLTGLPVELHTPRKTTPRTEVPTGSVGIGGAQTGIYTLATPGGWNLLGRTPIRLFRPEADEPAWLRVGDHVLIERITAKQFETWSE